MITVDWVIAALLEKHATVESVARTIGVLNPEREDGGFAVQPSEVLFERVLIGSKSKNAADASPDYVDVRLKKHSSIPIDDITACGGRWKMFPNNAKLSPYLYGCNAQNSTKEVGVNVMVTLSGDISDRSSFVVRIVLQRGAW
jgi:hypothetical protein